jgi:uncharacterized protein YjiS (DUF1127 family)
LKEPEDMSQLTQALRASRRAAITTADLARWLAALLRMEERWRQRQDLLKLDDHLLRDIGITREQARREASKPPWR